MHRTSWQSPLVQGSSHGLHHPASRQYQKICWCGIVPGNSRNWLMPQGGDHDNTTVACRFATWSVLLEVTLYDSNEAAKWIHFRRLEETSWHFPHATVLPHLRGVKLPCDTTFLRLFLLKILGSRPWLHSKQSQLSASNHTGVMTSRSFQIYTHIYQHTYEYTI